ncbi:uncharacterized protein CFP56_027420 [Quercus suber]|uniref:CCHC-type domain-containing protein n=1 Tax=Quercus suber TaxID=58331 RepID=A0AAW0JYD0_QUESU
MRTNKFIWVQIWVQIWGLPFDHINEEAGRDIGSSLGCVVVVDSKTLTADQARFLRVLIEILLNKPLCRGSPVVNPEGDKKMVAFKYERLVGLCFRCGTLGHEEKFCKLHLETEEGDHPYEEWMKVGYRGSQGTMRRHPQDFPQQIEGTDRSKCGGGSPQVVIESNSNSGVMIIYEKAKKSRINDEVNNIPPETEAIPTATNMHLMLIDPTSNETEKNDANEDFFETANQGNDLYRVPINYGINSIPFYS